jgi:hypothetical protein
MWLILQPDTLQQVAKDVNLQFGTTVIEAESIVQTLVEVEKLNYDKFADENPKVLLPTNLDLDNAGIDTSIKGEHAQNFVATSDVSLKKQDSPVSWTEVVKKGSNRNKVRSKSEKINSDDGYTLEY